MYFFLISFVLGLLLTLLVYIIFSKKSNTKMVYLSKMATVDPRLRNAVNMVGGDVLALLPASAREKKAKSAKLQTLFTRAANPWNVQILEFWIIQIVLGLAGFIVGLVLAFVFQVNFLVSALMILIPTLFLYNYPMLVYQDKANNREAEFKRCLPEAIDFMVMALSGGSASLPMAFEKTIVYMPDNVVREEFKRVVQALESGKSMTQALNELAERVPTEGIQAFVKALNNANQQAVPLGDILRARAAATRADLLAEVDRKIIVLPTKIMVTIGPIAYICILVIALAPTVQTLMSAFG